MGANKQYGDFLECHQGKPIILTPLWCLAAFQVINLTPLHLTNAVFDWRCSMVLKQELKTQNNHRVPYIKYEGNRVFCQY